MTDPTDPQNVADAPIDTLSFDDALATLQRTVAELEAGGQPLERSIALYERGVALHERCAKLLRVSGVARVRADHFLKRDDVGPDLGDHVRRTRGDDAAVEATAAVDVIGRDSQIDVHSLS